MRLAFFLAGTLLNALPSELEDRRAAASRTGPGFARGSRASTSASFERFCLAAGLEALAEMMEQDALAACGERHERGRRRKAHRWARRRARSGFTAARSR